MRLLGAHCQFKLNGLEVSAKWVLNAFSWKVEELGDDNNPKRVSSLLQRTVYAGFVGWCLSLGSGCKSPPALDAIVRSP